MTTYDTLAIAFPERNAAPPLTLTPPTTDGARFRMWCRKLLRATERALAIIGLALIIYHAAFKLDVMISGSMSPTLRGNGRSGSDWVLSEHVTHWFRAPRRWELLAFRNREGVQIMKRVVALPGENVVLKKDGTFLIDGNAVVRPASLSSIEYFPWGTLSSGIPVNCSKGYFVLGDYSKDSDDSRWNSPVEPSAINGRPWLIIWPLSRIGFVNP